MNIPSLLSLFDRYQRIEITYPDMRRESFPQRESFPHQAALPAWVRFTRPAPGMSFVLYSRLDENNAEAVIEEQVAYFAARSMPFEWKVYGHDAPADLGKRLAKHGSAAEEPEAVMLLDIQQAPASLFLPSKADIRRLTTSKQLDQVIHVLEGVWGGDFGWVTERLGGHMKNPGFLSVYVGYAHGQPACAAWIYFHENNPFAGLWGGSTLEAFRQQGFYTAILAARVQEARLRGVRYLVVDASPMSQPILAKLGFQVLTTAQAFEFKAKS